MIELIAQDGAQLFVNPDPIWHVRSNGADFTAIFGTSGAALFVRGSVGEVVARIEEGKQRDRSQEVVSGTVPQQGQE